MIISVAIASFALVVFGTLIGSAIHGSVSNLCRTWQVKIALDREIAREELTVRRKELGLTADIMPDE